MVEREEKCWLVKSNQRIIGPISQAEIVRRLKSRELGLADDASSPGRRWQSIQEHPDFKDIVEDVRRFLVSDETEVSFNAGGTQTLTDFSESELTEELSDKISQLTRTTEIVIHDLPEERRPESAGGGARFQTSGFSQNPILRQKADRTTKWLWLVTALALIGALAVIVQRKIGRGETRPQSVESLKEQLPLVIQSGDYAKALEELKSVFPDPLRSGEMGIYMAPLLIQVEGQTLVARRILNQMLANNQGDAKLEFTALGIADLIDNQLSGAEKNFQKALAIDHDYVPAMINLAAVKFQRADYEDARRTVLNAIRINPGEGEAQMLLSETAVYLNERTKSTEPLDQALKELASYRAHQLDYEPEAAFYTLYLDFLKAGRKANDGRVTAFLETDPQLTDDHRHNVFIYKGHVRWSVLGRFCEQVADQMGDNPRGATLRAVCFSKQGRKLDARTWIEKAVAQAPLDPLVQAWYSYVLNENGMGDQASVALGRASELNRKGEFEIPYLMQARFCQQAGDNECARANWQKIFTKNDRSISAIGGLAITYAAIKSYGEATSFIDRGLKLSPDYIPLLKLRLKGQKEGWYGRS